MNKINYDNILISVIDQNLKEKKKPKLLLHSCCAPCSSACIMRVKDAFDLTVFYYNPNMDSEEEYQKRAKEQIRLCEALKIKYAVMDYNGECFYEAVKGLESEKEGGKRCEACFYLRLTKTCEYAEKNGFDYFATTLTLSPLKNAELINCIGNEISKSFNVKYLVSDFKKRGGYLQSTELSKQYNLYRQNYCGCIFSKR